LAIKRCWGAEYIQSLRRIRNEGTDEFLVSFFFRAATARMKDTLMQKRSNTCLGAFLFWFSIIRFLARKII